MVRAFGRLERRERDVLVDNSRAFLAWPQRKLLIAYEDLVKQPEADVRTLAAYLGVEEQRADECIEKLPLIQEVARGTLSRPAHSTSLDFYRREREGEGKGEEGAEPPSWWARWAGLGAWGRQWGFSLWGAGRGRGPGRPGDAWRVAIPADVAPIFGRYRNGTCLMYPAT